MEHVLYQAYDSFKEREPRYRMLSISVKEVLSVLFGTRRLGHCLEIRQLECLPADVEVVAIERLECPTHLQVLLWHPTFDPVPLGHCTPPILKRSTLVRLQRLADADGYEVYQAPEGLP